MQDSARYMTTEVISKVLAKFAWPESYLIEDESPDGIAVIFPKCTLYFFEGENGEIALKFLGEDTGLETAVSLKQIMVALGGVSTPNLIDDRSVRSSISKVENNLRDLCVILLTNFASSLRGDFSWLDTYRAARAAKR